MSTAPTGHDPITASSPLPQRILLVRMDRIGDLILTLPVDQALPGAQCRWWITQGLKFIAETAEPPRKAKEISRQIQWSDFYSLLKDLRAARFDAAVIFHAPWWISLAVWLAGIPVRGGVKSQWHSWLFLNRGIRQKRSRAETSEFEYNFRLVEDVFELPRGSLERRSLKLSAPEVTREQMRRKFNLNSGSYVVVHPGMAGSARNWPIENYAILIRELTRTRTVVITGTKSDEPYLSPLRAKLESHPNLLWLDQKLSSFELIAVLSAAESIVAPSTGVLHLAASTGQPTLGIYSPVKVQQPVRWGPQGPRVATLMPQVNCPGENRCLGESCREFDCMTRITSEAVMSQLNQMR